MCQQHYNVVFPQSGSAVEQETDRVVQKETGRIGQNEIGSETDGVFVCFRWSEVCICFYYKIYITVYLSHSACLLPSSPARLEKRMMKNNYFSADAHVQLLITQSCCKYCYFSTLANFRFPFCQ